LYKNNAAIWYNETCKLKQLTPSYINIEVSGTNPQSQETKNVAIRYRINQELKFLYAKKPLSRQLYNIHLECAVLWPSTWQLIQTMIDRKLQQQMEMCYKHINKKLECLQQKQPKSPKSSRRKDEQHIYPRMKN